MLGVPRDWAATVGLDAATGLGWAGGYVGTGVTATNLAGRTLADLVLGRDTELTRLPWVGHRARSWEIEPLRWLAVNAIYTAYHAADRAEASGRSARTSAVRARRRSDLGPLTRSIRLWTKRAVLRCAEAADTVRKRPLARAPG